MILIKAPSILLEEPVLPFNIDQMDPVPIALDMIDLMNVESGLGLSANQVGLNAQIFVMKAILNKTFGSPLVVMNPHIKSISNNREASIEGCLSHPGLYLKVKRPTSIVVEFETLTDDYKSVINVETKFDDIDARVFLHEYDHLHGIQFINRVSKLKLTMAEKRRKKKEHV
jgi:peptide deformylase